MGRQKDDPVITGPLQHRAVILLLHRRLQRVDGRIAGHKYLLRILVLLQEILQALHGRRKMKLRKIAHHLPVRLFRIGRIQIMSPQTGLHMPDRYPVVKR